MEFNVYQNRITTHQNELNFECTNAEVLHTIAAAAGKASGQQPHFQPVSIPNPEKFDGSRDKLQSFVSHLCMKRAHDPSHLPNSQHQLQFTFRYLVGQASAMVEASINDESINLADVPALITVLETGFVDPECVAIAEQTWEVLKQTIRNFFTYYPEFAHYATNI
jgi:hypothetical protein